MYQLMLFEDMIPEYVPSVSEFHTDEPQRFQVCNIEGVRSPFTIKVDGEQDPETIALQTLGYFVVPECSFAHE
jgi:hypothetical protein